MSERIAVVTGASRGVGKGVAHALGAAGWTVYLTGRGAGLAESADGVSRAGGRGVAIVCDHRDDDQVAALFERVRGEAGRLDLLVNNAWAQPAGLTPGVPFWKRPVSDWDDLIGIALRAHYVAAVAAAHLMVAGGGGLIVNISSPGARYYLHSVLYGIAKAGLDKMAHDMAVELAGTRVTALSLWPGLVRTEKVLGLGVDEVMGFPVADGETPEFVGRVIAALAAEPDVGRHAGRSLVAAEVAPEYAVTDVDGRQPASPRPMFADRRAR